MKCKGSLWAVQLTVLIVGLSIAALAQKPREICLRGTVSDYTPVTGGGPWEVRGQWSLTLKRNGKADFSAALNMVRSDQGVLLSGGGDLNDPKGRMAHTHHISLVNGTVTFPASGGIEVTGPATITANGSFPPPFGPNSSLKIDITGGSSISLSNLMVTFEGDAQNHFGAQSVHGVVRVVK